MTGLRRNRKCAIAIDTAENLPIEVLSSNNAIKQLLHTIPGFGLSQEKVLVHNLSYSMLYGFHLTEWFSRLKDQEEFTEITHKLEQYAC